MSHFFVCVIVPPETEHIEDKVAELLAPYDENGEWSRNGSRWDWWVIGGRWDGELFTEQELPRMDDGQGGFNFGEEFHQLKRNSRPVSQLNEDFSCRAIITPDGAWHEQSRMGWFGISSDDSDEQQAKWLGEMRRLLAEHNACVAVGVDCHV
jgi:hypothetical protein